MSLRGDLLQNFVVDNLETLCRNPWNMLQGSPKERCEELQEHAARTFGNMLRGPPETRHGDSSKNASGTVQTRSCTLPTRSEYPPIALRGASKPFVKKTFTPSVRIFGYFGSCGYPQGSGNVPQSLPGRAENVGFFAPGVNFFSFFPYFDNH